MRFSEFLLETSVGDQAIANDDLAALKKLVEPLSERLPIHAQVSGDCLQIVRDWSAGPIEQGENVDVDGARRQRKLPRVT